MDVSRLRKGEWVAGLSGLALLILLFLPWYGGADGVTSGAPGWVAYAPAEMSDASAWQVFSVVDLLLLLTALAGLTVAVMAALQRAPALPVASAVIATGIAIVMVLVVLYRIVNQPGPNDLVGVRIGAYLGLLAVLGVAAGGWLTMGDERTNASPAPLVPAQPAPDATAAEGSVVARRAVPDAAPQRES
ncbi:MAG: hypothetical protein AVDCRST_MAG30-773 [uncultured Solirubrobacteraceae bacterium]|uniref:Uncharacterized protein n=1 Tax=uncultured Solirubrobacteraceae bacterium TaxID=1162706 RepID=A0A6J4RTM9_9ACTN|nr:MAG: hypothetical protein AVDCRST_MAG30-773 [uncultured Solirubrobacteraceae bacterium]